MKFTVRQIAICVLGVLALIGLSLNIYSKIASTDRVKYEENKTAIIDTTPAKSVPGKDTNEVIVSGHTIEEQKVPDPTPTERFNYFDSTKPGTLAPPDVSGYEPFKKFTYNFVMYPDFRERRFGTDFSAHDRDISSEAFINGDDISSDSLLYRMIIKKKYKGKTITFEIMNKEDGKWVVSDVIYPW